jgi:hypothetical protein
MTDSTKTTEQSQTSQTNPWAQAQPLLTNLLGQYGNANTAVTGDQSSALNNLQSSASSIPNFGDAASSAIGKIFGADNSGQVGLLNNAYSTLQNNLGATASGANLDPYSTPGFADAINTATNDITNKVKSTYAASGRDPSGAGSFAGSLGRGLTSGIAPTIASQYNQNYANMAGANNSLLSGASSTASGINNLNTSQVQSLLAGIGGAGSVGSLYTSPATSQLAAANAAYSQPYANLAQLLQPSVSLAGLGSSSSGTGNSTSTSQPSLLDSISSGFKTGGTGLSALSALFALSDERAKDDIAPVGKLNDGQTVFSYRYKGSPKTEIGLLAQDVEKRDPEAVATLPNGLKMVNYHRATRHARVGALKQAA